TLANVTANSSSSLISSFEPVCVFVKIVACLSGGYFQHARRIDSGRYHPDITVENPGDAAYHFQKSMGSCYAAFARLSRSAKSASTVSTSRSAQFWLKPY